MPICKLAQAYLDRVRSRCVPWRHKKSKRMACIDSRMLSTTVASPCQRYILAGETHANSPAHQLAVSRMRSSPRVLHFSAFHCDMLMCVA